MNIGEAKTRLSELVAAAVRGDTVVLQKAGKPMVRLVPEPQAEDAARAARRAKRLAALGMYRGMFTDEQLDEVARPLDDETTALFYGGPIEPEG